MHRENMRFFCVGEPLLSKHLRSFFGANERQLFRFHGSSDFFFFFYFVAISFVHASEAAFF